ncbi:hypothetical protein [Amycolatopsis sp. NPDC051128]|uniref:hypothetical protein n=1 Tax=Amycolatopsis sp. NPDC051128 TaxID=3155412 RepID=UPI003447686B
MTSRAFSVPSPTTKSSGRIATLAGPSVSEPRFAPVSRTPAPSTVAEVPAVPVTVRSRRLRSP